MSDAVTNSAEVIIRVEQDGDMAFKAIGNARLFTALVGAMKIAEDDILRKYWKHVNFGLENLPFDKNTAADKNAAVQAVSAEVEMERSEALDKLMDAMEKIKERMQAMVKSQPGTKFKIDLQSLSNL